MRLGTGERILFIGDSITDCGRRQPVGDGRDGLGNGYVSVVHALLQATYPELRVRVLNMGTGGHTVRHLHERWQRDVLDLRPDWVAVMIGINDVWRQFDSPTIPESHVPLEEYEPTLRGLAAATRPAVRGLVLMTPFYLEPNRADPMRAAMDRYGMAVRRIAQEQDALFVDTQAAFDAVLRHLYPGFIAGDRVHPNLVGHAVLARAFLDAVGFDWGRRPA
jgi:lysophospholipase L1-like esterase